MSVAYGNGGWALRGFEDFRNPTEGGMKATLQSITISGENKWLVTFDVGGSLCVFEVTQGDSNVLTPAFAEVLREEPESPEAIVLEHIQDELRISELFEPFYDVEPISDEHFSWSVTGASLHDHLYWVDPALRGFELFQTLLAHAQMRVRGIEDPSDYSEVAHLAQELWVLASMMERVVEKDPPYRIVSAVQRISTVFQDADSDEAGIRVHPDYESEIEEAREIFLEVSVD
jgi:hypothetical protein